MKISKQLRQIHQDAQQKFVRLEMEVQETLKPRVEDSGWFFLGRIKQLESFVLKVETGRVPDPKNMEDFFACTIIVPTMIQIDSAEELVRGLYDIESRRPPDDTKTHKASSSFAFDDLRLYVRRRSPDSGKNEDLSGLIFEVQIKTILQHAWSVATHDLIYKTDSISWSRERIAFQVKAMLEHAEIAIAEANRLSDAQAVAKKDERTDNILRIIEQLEDFWPNDRLPSNIKRLSETVYDLLKISDIEIHKLKEMLNEEKRRVGLLPIDLSPYEFVIQSLANTSIINFREKFNRRHIKTRIVIRTGIDLPAWAFESHDRIINLGE